MARLGWIGLGDIGTPMSERLRRAGHDVLVWGRSREKVARTVADPDSIADSPADLMRRCDAVFLCVTDADAVEEVVFGDRGLAHAQKPGGLVVDHSTIGPLRTRDMAGRLAGSNAGHWVDAPVSGGAAGARAGTLAAMAGGRDEDVARVRSWISAYAGTITHAGPAGAGQMCKICNQVIANATIMAWAEMLALAERFGVSGQTLMDAAAGGFGDSNVRKHLVPKILDGTFPGIYAPLIPKDLGLATAFASRVNAPAPVAELVLALYREHFRLADRGTAAQTGLRGLFVPADPNQARASNDQENQSPRPAVRKK